MNIKQLFALIALSYGLFIPYTESYKTLLLKNNTGTQLRIISSFDGQMGTLLIDNQETKPMFFDTIDTLQIIPENGLSLRSTIGMAPEEYLGQIKTDLEKQGNLFISINPPESSGWFGAATSYIKPYSLKNIMSPEKTDELLNSTLQDQFPVALKSLSNNPQASLGAAEALGLNPQFSLEEIMKNIKERLFLWKYAALQAQTAEQKQFARRVTAILKTLGELATLTLTSPIPKDWNPHKYKSKDILLRNNQINVDQTRQALRLYLLGTDAEIEQKLGPVAENPTFYEGNIQVSKTVGKFLEALGIAKRV